MREIRAFSNEAAMLCTGAFALLLATGLSNYLRADIDTGDASLIACLGRLMVPGVPLVLIGGLLLARWNAAATLVAGLATLYYLFDWVMM